jgi:type 1 fimbria pilin
VVVLDQAATVNVPPSYPAETLEASLNADLSFSALIVATAADNNPASTTGTVTLSGGVG